MEKSKLHHKEALNRFMIVFDVYILCQLFAIVQNVKKVCDSIFEY